MPAKKKGGRPPKVGQGLWDENQVEEKVEVMVRPDDGLDTTEDLDEEQRAMFARLLRKKMSLEERAEQLISLAKLTDTKRAAVGLRAIQEINAITGIHDNKPQEAPPMFQLPEGTSVSVRVEKVVK